jgi:macrolide-specific efflux system membrane fusion protein
MPIIAPVDGDVIARSVEPGQTVTANEKMFVIADRLIVQAQIDETDIGRVKRGQLAEFTLDAYPANNVTGIVDQIAYDAQTVNNVTMYMVDILPARVPPFMRSGMTANILLVTALTNDVLMLPITAVHTKGKEAVVWQKNPAGSNKIIDVKVRTGMNDGKKIEIVTGLNEGDQALVTATRMPEAKKTTVNPFSPIRPRGR